MNKIILKKMVFPYLGFSTLLLGIIFMFLFSYSSESKEGVLHVLIISLIASLIYSLIISVGFYIAVLIRKKKSQEGLLEYGKLFVLISSSTSLLVFFASLLKISEYLSSIENINILSVVIFTAVLSFVCNYLVSKLFS